MLRSLHLSGRRLRPATPRFPVPLNPPLPSSQRSTRPRFLSSSRIPGGAGRATYDYDPLINSLSASASETPAESDAWVVFDPVAGRIVIQRPPLSSSSTEGDEGEGEGAGEREDEGKAGVKEKEKGKGKGKGKRKGKWNEKMKGWVSASGEEEEGEGAREREDEEKAGVKEKKEKTKWKVRPSASGEDGETSRSSVAAERKSAGKGGKECVSYVCSHCGEGDSQWWGICRHCRTRGTLRRWTPGLTAASGGGVAPGEREGEENAGVKEKGKGKGKGKAKWKWDEKMKGWVELSDEEGQTSRSSVAAALKSAGKGGKERVSYVCSHCGESHPRWWGYCHHCKATRTLFRHIGP